MFSLDQYRALHDGAGLVDRSHRGRLMLTGGDRRAYLQGLLTNDILALTPGTGCYAAYLTAQGRMIADMRLFETGNALMVDLDGSLAEPVRARWAQFIFSEDVEVRDLSAATAQLGVYGRRAADAVAAALTAALVEPPPHGRELELSADPDTPATTPENDPPTGEVLRALAPYGNRRWVVHGAPVVVVQSDDAGVRGFDVVVPGSRRDQFAALLRSAGGVEVGRDAAEVSRVESGRPLFLVDMDTDTIPLEAGIEDRAISLTKGCYVGQEIIIRVLHRGHGRVARRLVGVTFDPAAAVPAKGERLRSGEREVGTITSAVASPGLGRPIALATVHRDFVEPGTVLNTSAASATVTALPFVRAA